MSQCPFCNAKELRPIDGYTQWECFTILYSDNASNRTETCHERQHANTESTIMALGQRITNLLEIAERADKAVWRIQPGPLGEGEAESWEEGYKRLEESNQALGAKCAGLEEEVSNRYNKDFELRLYIAQEAKRRDEAETKLQQDLAAERAQLSYKEAELASMKDHVDRWRQEVLITDALKEELSQIQLAVGCDHVEGIGRCVREVIDAAQARTDALSLSVTELLPYAAEAAATFYDGTQGHQIRKTAEDRATRARKALAGEGGLRTKERCECTINECTCEDPKLRL